MKKESFTVDTASTFFRYFRSFDFSGKIFPYSNALIPGAFLSKRRFATAKFILVLRSALVLKSDSLTNISVREVGDW